MIRDVWAPNLEQEMRNIREAIEVYPYVALVSDLQANTTRLNMPC
jgi:CCR4-NOT transcription complex subunit 7/8